MSFSFKPNQPASQPQAPSAPAPAAAVPAAAPIKVGGMPLMDREEHKIGTVKLLLIGVFSLLILVTVLLFAYQRYLVSRIESQKLALAEADKELGKLNLEAMRDLSNRMKVVKQVLAEHASVSTAFLLLEESIEHPVTYTRFDLTRMSGAQGGYELKLGATASSYKAVAQQLDTLKSETYKQFVPSVKYDGLSLDESGNVNFNLSMPILIQGKLPESVLVKTVEVVSDLPAASSTPTAATTTP